MYPASLVVTATGSMSANSLAPVSRASSLGSSQSGCQRFMATPHRAIAHSGCDSRMERKVFPDSGYSKEWSSVSARLNFVATEGSHEVENSTTAGLTGCVPGSCASVVSGARRTRLAANRDRSYIFSPPIINFLFEKSPQRLVALLNVLSAGLFLR